MNIYTITDLIHSDVTHVKVNRFQLLQAMQQQFWKRCDYLYQQNKQRHMVPEAFGVGTIVVIKKKNLPLLRWKLNRRCGDVFEEEWRDTCSVNMTSMVSLSGPYRIQVHAFYQWRQSSFHRNQEQINSSGFTESNSISRTISYIYIYIIYVYIYTCICIMQRF